MKLYTIRQSGSTAVCCRNIIRPKEAENYRTRHSKLHSQQKTYTIIPQLLRIPWPESQIQQKTKYLVSLAVSLTIQPEYSYKLYQAMRVSYCSKPAKITSRSLKKQPQGIPNRLQPSRAQAECYEYEQPIQKEGCFRNVQEKDVDQWIFDDEKVKFERRGTTQNYHIRSRLSIHRKDKHSPVQLFEEQKNTQMPEMNQPTTQSQKEQQWLLQTQKVSFCHPPKPRKQDGKNEDKLGNISKLLTHRYPVHPGMRSGRHANTSLEASPIRNHFLKPTAFSIELKKPNVFGEGLRSPKRERIYRAKNTLTPTSKRSRIDQKAKLIQREHTFTGNGRTRNMYQINPAAQTQKFLLNGWEVQNPSFHDFDELYKQKSKDPHQIALPKQFQVFHNKIVRIAGL